MGMLEGMRALVTGAAAGIGRAASILFAREGARVGLMDIDPAGAETAQAIHADGGQAVFIAGDVTQSHDCENAVALTVESFGGLDILLNAAGVMVRKTVLTLDESEWDRVMDINAKGVYLMCRKALAVMGPGSSIINVASGWGLVGGPRAVAYCASKGAIVLMTKAMAIDHGPQGIRVNCLCPGDTDTSMLRDEARQLGIPEVEFLAQAARRPLGRIGTPEEIAQAAAFLASERSAYVTGAVLVVDGGGLAGG